MKQDALVNVVPGTEMIAGYRVGGLSFRSIAGLMKRFSALADLFSGDSISADRIYEVGPDAVAAVLTCAILDGDSETEQEVDRLVLGVQFQMLDAMISATFPDGVANFRDRLLRMASALGDEGNAAAGAAGKTTASPPSPKN